MKLPSLSRQKFVRTLLTSTLALIVLLPACKKENNNGELRPALGGKFYGGTFRDNETGEARGCDPPTINDASSSHIAEQIFDNLLRFNDKLELQPELATSFDVSADGMTYTYHLRSDVQFHDDPCFPTGKGRKFTASDVHYSLSRLCDARAGSRNFDYLNGKVIGANAYYEATTKALVSGQDPAVKSVEGFVVVNDSTFQIKLTKPFGPFENYVALSGFMIHPREAVEKYGKDFARHPVGTGPYQWVSYQQDKEFVMKRNPHYWGRDEFGNQLPFTDGVVFSFIKDEKTQLFEFREGKLHESYRIPSEFFEDIVSADLKPKGEWSKFQLFAIPALSTQYYGMLTISPIFKDKRVRQAFNYAVDRDKLVTYVLKGQAAGAAVHGLIPPPMPGYDSKATVGYDFNPEKARQLLAEAGFPNGKGFPFVELQLNQGGGRNVLIAEAVQSMLRENLGVDCKMKQVEFAKHLDELDAGKAPFFRLGWIADYPDPENFLNLWWGKLVPDVSKPSPQNAVRYKSAEFDRAFEDALATPDRTERMKKYQIAEQIAMNDAPMLLTIYDLDFRLVQPYIKDYKNNAMDRRAYKHVWFDKNAMK